MLAPPFGRIAIDSIEPEAYRGIVRAWCAQRDGRPFPERDKIEPFLVPSLSGNLILYEVAGRDLVFRVVGENVATAVGSRLKGKTLRQALGGSEYVQMIERQLHECAASGTPLYSIHDVQLPGRALPAATHGRKAWRIALPYGEGARVNRLLCYQTFSQEVEPPFQKDVDFAVLLPRTVFVIEV